jgi:hypothetical protein
MHTLGFRNSMLSLCVLATAVFAIALTPGQIAAQSFRCFWCDGDECEDSWSGSGWGKLECSMGPYGCALHGGDCLVVVAPHLLLWTEQVPLANGEVTTMLPVSESTKLGWSCDSGRPFVVVQSNNRKATVHTADGSKVLSRESSDAEGTS